MKFSKISFYPKIFLLWKGILLSSTHTPSVQHIGSTQGPHLFSTRNPSVPHQNPLSSTPKTPQNWRVCWTEECVELRAFCVKLRGVWNWRVFGVELWNFWCWTERFLVWNWGVCWTEGGVKLSEWKVVESLTRIHMYSIYRIIIMFAKLCILTFEKNPKHNQKTFLNLKFSLQSSDYFFFKFCLWDPWWHFN